MHEKKKQITEYIRKYIIYEQNGESKSYITFFHGEDETKKTFKKCV